MVAGPLPPPVVRAEAVCQNKPLMTSSLKHLLPAPLRRWLREKKVHVQRQMLPLDRLSDFSLLRRVRPYRKDFGWYRGKCVDRYYIEQFLLRHSADIHGRAVEIGQNLYMKQFGGERIAHADVLDFVARPEVTLLADLNEAPAIPDDSFDCIICTQTLMCLYNPAAAVRTCFRTLAPGGVALVTVSGISQIVPPKMTGGSDDFWRFTCASAHKLFANVFGAENITVESFGNVLTATALLHGLVVEELTPEEFAYNDPNYPVIVAVRAVKPHA
jgi:SAM-dependent methyltransferase